MTDSGIIVVGIGACALARSPVKIKTFGLGSCVGITLYDRRERIGGLVHTMLPTISHSRTED
ncbi:MAG TPA: chemotaxis protein CheD, partial [Methanosarcina sp.]|nr:chemotaxis protein CheD [Methanosarcina sp.]